MQRFRPRHPGSAVAALTLLFLLCSSALPAQSTEDRLWAEWNDPEQRVAPFRIFDNVYFVGLGWVSAYLVTTSDGLVLIDALYGDFTEHAVEGIRALGFDPDDLRYVLVTHGHFDHAGGAAELQQRFGAQVVMTEADWKLAAAPPSAPRYSFPLPKRDVVAHDGDRLTVGDTEFAFYVTPGHTEGVLSIELPANDGDATHRAFLFGGVGLNFSGVERTERYLSSVDRIGRLSRTGDRSIGVRLTNHPGAGEIFERRDRLAQRPNGAPHPFVDPRGVPYWLDHLARNAEAKLLDERLAAGQHLDNEQVEALDRLLARYDSPAGPGVSLSIARGGRTVWSRGYGSANLDHGAPLEPNSPVYIASTSKQFTAALVAHLALSGKLSLDDPIRKWIPELLENDPPLLVRHLVHHTSGIRDYLALMSLQQRPFGINFTNNDALDLIGRQRGLNFDPGSNYRYSNSNYALLITLVERVTGSSAQELSDTVLFEPLGMRRTSWGDQPTAVRFGRATSYDPWSASEVRRHTQNFAAHGDGNLWSTTEDLLRWANGLDGQASLDPALIELVHRRGALSDGTELSYAFGLIHGHHRGLEVFSHSGAFLGFRTELLRVPSEKLAVAVLSNDGSVNAPGLARDVVDLLIGPLDEGDPGVPDRLTAAELPSARLGEYFDDSTGQVARLGGGAQGARLLRGGRGIPLFQLGDHLVDQARSFAVELVEGGFEVTAPGQPKPSFYRRLPANSREASLDVGELAGSYRSEELDRSWHLESFGDHRLNLAIPNGPSRLRLRRLDERTFHSPQLAIQFEGSSGELDSSGFVVLTPRASGMRFERTP